MKIKFFVAIFFLIFSIITSCRRNFTLDELEKLKTDSISLEGSFAAPLVNTELSLKNFIPENDSTFWIEIDEQELVHLKMYIRDLVVLRMNEIFNAQIYPAGTGVPILPDTAFIQSDTSKMKVYTKMLGGRLFFKNPKITFKIDNAIPVVTFFKMDTLTFHDDEMTAISHTSDKEYVINAPSVLGSSIHSDILIDTTEMPVLPEVFSPVPKYISFYLSMGNHTLQNLPFDVTGEEQMNVDVDIDLPLDVLLDTLVMGDTTDFKLTNDTYEQIKSLTLRIRINNGFPIDGYSQIYFADTTDTGEIGNLVDSVFTDLNHPFISESGWNLVAADTDASGIVTQPNESDIEIFIDQERLNSLRNLQASKLIITGKLNSLQSDEGFFIKILGNYKMGVKIAVKADFDGTVN